MKRLAAGVGLLNFPFEGAAAYWRWVDVCEAEGADSLWQSDRLVGSMPVLECLATLAAVAGRTRRIKFGMNVLSAAMRDPVLAAKQCATIDILSEGRHELPRHVVETTLEIVDELLAEGARRHPLVALYAELRAISEDWTPEGFEALLKGQRGF